MELAEPAGLVEIKAKKFYSDSFVLRCTGNCMDSAEAATRVRDGEYLLVHPIPMDEAEGKVVVINLPDVLYVKQAVRVTSTHLTARCFNPYRTDIRIPIGDISAVYSVDEVLGDSVNTVPIMKESANDMPYGWRRRHVQKVGHSV